MNNDLLTLAPLITVFLGAIAVLASAMITPNRNHAPVAVALAALGATAALLINQGGSTASALGGKTRKPEPLWFGERPHRKVDD